ncbi:3-oxoadipate enol-lactonase [compost metagenome]
MKSSQLAHVDSLSSTNEASTAPSASATATEKVERSLVVYGDVQIETLGQGRGPIIVILPSLGRAAEDYDDVSARLADNAFRVLRPQPRGIGQSRGPMRGLDMHSFAADIGAVLDNEKTGAAVIVGHAWGSQPARMLAVDRPDLVRGLVMAAASAGKLPPGFTEKPYSRMREAIDGSGNLALPESQRLHYLEQAFFAPGHDARSWLSGWFPETHEAQAEARNITSIDAYFGGGSVPILDLQAEFDSVVVPNVFGPMLGDRVTTAVIPDAGHALAPEQPAAMSDAIARFARRVYQMDS